jgi:CheY-like chemotaxis protein
MAGEVLIVDDEVLVARSIELFLNALGVPTCTITDPVKVEPYALVNEPAVILLDYRMQPVTGKDILIRLRRSGVACPVVVMTAYATQSCFFEFKALGANAILPKPFFEEELRRILEECGVKIPSSPPKPARRRPPARRKK